MTPKEPTEKIDRTVSSVLQELAALRGRLDEAPEWFRNPDATIRAAALAKEIEQLCRQAALCDDPVEIEPLLAASSRCLDEMQTLLGTH